MSAEGYRFENQVFRSHSERAYLPRIEEIPLLQRGDELGVQTLSRRTNNSEKRNRTSFAVQNERPSLLNGLGKTAQVTTLATLELLASATSVVAGGIVAGGALHFPFTAYTLLAMNLPIFPGIIVPITLSAIGLGLIIVGMKRIGAATKRVRSLF